MDLLLISSYGATLELYLGESLLSSLLSCFGYDSFFRLIFLVSLNFSFDSLCFLKLNLMRELELLKFELLFPERYCDFLIEIVPNFKLLYFCVFLGVTDSSVDISES